MKLFRVSVLAALAAAALFVSCSDSAGPTAATPTLQNDNLLAFPQDGATSTSDVAFTKAGLPDFARMNRLPTITADDEDFNCTNVEKTRVRFGHPGFVNGTSVGLFAEFDGMPGEGSKILRVWWDFENDPDTFEDLDISQDVLPGDNGLFDWDGILEHNYDVRSEAHFRVRLELIIPGQTGNCARVRDVFVEPIGGGGGGVPGAGVIFPASGFRDEFVFNGTPGATVTITVDTTRASTAFDPAWILFSDAGGSGFIRSQDDDFPCTFPPPIFSCPTGSVTLPADPDGKYYLQVWALGSYVDPTRADYRLTITGAGSPKLVNNDF